MKKGKFLRSFTVVILLVSMLTSFATVFTFAATEVSEQNAVNNLYTSDASDEFDSVLYEEDFNDVNDTVLESGKANTIASAGTWFYTKGTTDSNGSAYIEDGRLYFSGNKYDYIYLLGGENWTNYILEADFCYTDDNSDFGWVGMMYNVVELSDGGLMAQKGGTLLAADGRATLNGAKKLVNGDCAWSNNDGNKNLMNMTNAGLTIPGRDEPIRLKITVYENTATLYYAFLDNNGEMTTPYIKIMSIDNIPSDNQRGSIGFMTSKGNTGSCWVDNIKCQNLMYEENFDNITERVDIALGENTSGPAEGWVYNKHNGGNGVAYIQNGKLYMAGGEKAYDVLYRAAGTAWENYTLEADFCYESNNATNGWGGMLYNVQSATKFQKGAITPAGAATLNGYDGNWTNNNAENSSAPTKNHHTMTSGAPGKQPFRMKICVYGETAALYYAMLNEDGTRKTQFVHVMTIDNIPANARKGSIGFMTSAWGNYGSFWVDNIKCYPAVFMNYAESFDSVEGRVDIQAGINNYGDAKGWIYNKKAGNSKAYIENGRLYFSGSKYDVIYRDGGEVWGNYTLEADFCYENDNTSWGGILYNVQDDGNRFQKAGIGLDGNYTATLNGNEGGIWTNNNPAVNHYAMKNTGLELPAKGKPFRLKVTVYNKTATLYYAMLDEGGNMKTDFIKIFSINDIPADNQTGSIGLMTSGNDQYASFWVDNIKCYSETPVSYTENFDSYSNYTISPNAIDKNVGFYFDRNSTSADDSRAEVKDGALYLYGGTASYDALFFTTGDNWTNYVVETDFAYLDAGEEGLNNDGWAGILFRSNSVNDFYKGLVEISDSNGVSEGVLNGKLNNQWYMNDYAETRANYTSGKIEVNEKYRIRIAVNENTASLYIGRYNGTTLGDWVHVITITDRFAPIHMQGTIGLIVGGGIDSRYRAIKIDNVSVSQIPGADRLYKEPNVADIYEAETGIVNPPVAVEVLTSDLPAVNGERAAVVMVEIDANLNVLDKNGSVLTTASNFIDTYRKALIPAFVVDNETEADALSALIHSKDLTDAYVIADADKASLVKRVRMANDITAAISGALVFDDINSEAARRNARALVADNMSYVAISRSPLTEETAFYFAARQVAAWSFANSTAEVYRGIANGYHGIVSENVSTIYDVYESITETTVSGRTVVIAHRGANDQADIPYPENTLIGIRAAKEKWGAAAIELDFGLTKDNYVVLMHDDTVDRTTNGTGKVSSFTLEEIKALTVDYVAGKETTVPTLEEVIVLAKEFDIVLYCHVKDMTDANIAAFSYLVEKYDFYENVILFAATETIYNSNTDRVCFGTAYELNNSPVVADGIIFTAGDKNILSSCVNHLDGVEQMKNALTQYNYQPLFYPYLNQGNLWREESFYYQLSARGFVNTHSITDGQERMDKLALTESGCVGWLTDNPHLSDDYHYAIDLSKEKLTFKVGEAINLEKTLKLIVGDANINCGLVQINGNTLDSIDGRYILNEAGKVTVVYYATRTTDGGTTYRVYSEPITLTFIPDEVFEFAPMSNITLGSELVYNVYVPAKGYLKSFTVDGKTYPNANIVTLDDGERYYHIAVPMAASEAAKNIVLKAIVTIDGKDYNGTLTMSIPKYAKKVIESSTSEEEIALVKDVLSYIRAAYAYFDKTDAEQIAKIDALLGENYDKNNAPDMNGSAEKPALGITAVTYNLTAKPGLRFYLAEGFKASDFVFSIKGSTVAAEEGSDANGKYVEVKLYAYELAETVDYTVNGESDSCHIRCYYEWAKTENNDNLVNLVLRFAKYCESAAAYRESVIN